MPAVRFVINDAQGVRGSLPPHPHVQIIAEGGESLTIPVAAGLELTNIVPRFQQYERVGLRPVLDHHGEDLRVQAGTFIFVGRNRDGAIDPTVDIERELHLIRKFARYGKRIQWRGYGPSEIGWWQITSLTIADKRRRHGDNSITVAEVTIQLTQASSATVTVGATSGGDRADPPRTNPATGAGQPRSRTYTVKSGDTLFKIARDQLGNGALYPKIAAANGITNPNLIRVGQVLKIPAP